MNEASAPNVLRVASLGILASVIAGPTLAADASNGERLAERWCAACHVVSLDQRQASSDAPPFASIAKRPNFSEAGIMTFLLDPHAQDAEYEPDTLRGRRHRSLHQQAAIE
jgi:mono/diheme cytochrome c family protein